MLNHKFEEESATFDHKLAELKSDFEATKAGLSTSALLEIFKNRVYHRADNLATDEGIFIVTLPHLQTRIDSETSCCRVHTRNVLSIVDIFQSQFAAVIPKNRICK